MEGDFRLFDMTTGSLSRYDASYLLCLGSGESVQYFLQSATFRGIPRRTVGNSVPFHSLDDEIQPTVKGQRGGASEPIGDMRHGCDRYTRMSSCNYRQTT